ncbi:MAG: hypothetical protein AAB574_01000 [Patescibacteria group bacterium]
MTEDKAASIFIIDPRGIQIGSDLRFNTAYPDFDIIKIHLGSKRITFSERVTRVDVFDAGGIQTVKRRFSGICKPFEIGIPPPTPKPVEGVRIRYKDRKNEPVVILGMLSSSI